MFSISLSQRMISWVSFPRFRLGVKVIFEFQLMAYFEIYVYFVVTVFAISCAPGKREHAYAFGESFLSLRRSQM